jgi:MoxR-like ATPase
MTSLSSRTITQTIPVPSGAPEEVHVFSAEERNAINAARAAGRALLVRGEPGTGKTQLAKAAALALKCAFVSHTVDSRTESRDLLWHVDAVARLGEAQRQGVLGRETGAASAAAALELKNFLQPRALWWGMNWQSAADQAKEANVPSPPLARGCKPENGVVVLIDEIDKGETDVPNGLLDVLGEGAFDIPGVAQRVTRAADTPAPLVLITTNEERVLPDAFIRRCLVLRLALPEERDELIAHLVNRGRAHFKNVSESLLKRAAGMLADDRATATAKNWRPRPGQAEFFDLVRAALALAMEQKVEPDALLDMIAPYLLRKSSEAGG